MDLIRIELTNGETLDNDPAYGLNFNDIADIQDCLQVVGYYRWTSPHGYPRRLGRDEIKRIYE